MGSIPTLEGTADRLVQIPGSMPRLNAIPRGCAFRPRCGSTFARCHVERPEPLRVGEHDVACFLYAQGSPAAAGHAAPAKEAGR
jgi:peptide/nickel transport system ATP-binding protein